MNFTAILWPCIKSHTERLVFGCGSISKNSSRTFDLVFYKRLIMVKYLFVYLLCAYQEGMVEEEVMDSKQMHWAEGRRLVVLGVLAKKWQHVSTALKHSFQRTV